MTTKEISDLTEKRHDNIIRDTENMLNELGECLLKFEGTYKSAQGKDVKCYILPKDLTLTLVSGYNIKMRKAIIDRWTELEEQKNKALPQTWQDKALFLAENLIEMNKQLEAQKPAVEFVQAITKAQGSFKIGDFAKILYDKNNLVIGQNRLFAWLYKHRYLQNSSTPYQRWIDQGLFEVTSGVIEGSSSGRIWKMVKVTGKGMVYLTEKIIESGEFESSKVYR